jgi:hypothetical protein
MATAGSVSLLPLPCYATQHRVWFSQRHEAKLHASLRCTPRGPLSMDGMKGMFLSDE